MTCVEYRKRRLYLCIEISRKTKREKDRATHRSLAVLFALPIPPSCTVKLKTSVRSSSSSAYWHTNFFYKKSRRGAESCGGEGKRTDKPPAFLHTETKVRVVMYDSRGWAGI